jgi:histidine triad (HIT) family protein|tara:strand:- start:84 stop:425 length:342 start_codon:yes stop_codon:yes gene_type:complete
MEDSLFTKIRKGDIPGKIVYQDDLCFAIEDINPQAPVHILIIPIKEIEKVSDASEEDINLLGHLLHVSKKIAQDHDLDNNYRLIINNGAGAGQSVFHIHVHLLGGRSLEWPPG